MELSCPPNLILLFSQFPFLLLLPSSSFHLYLFLVGLGEIGFQSPFIIDVHSVELAVILGVGSLWVVVGGGGVMGIFDLLGVMVARIRMRIREHFPLEFAELKIVGDDVEFRNENIMLIFIPHNKFNYLINPYFHLS